MLRKVTKTKTLKQKKHHTKLFISLLFNLNSFFKQKIFQQFKLKSSEKKLILLVNSNSNRVVSKSKIKMNENKRLREKSPPRRNDRCYRINVLRRFDTILLGAPWRWLRFYFEFTDFSRLLGWDLRIIFRGNDFRLYSSTFISLLDQYTHK